MFEYICERGTIWHSFISGPEHDIANFKKLVRVVFKAHFETGLYMMEFDLLIHLAENVGHLKALELVRSSAIIVSIRT